MNKEFVTYEQAIALKGINFNEPCIAMYNSNGFLFIGEELSITETEVVTPTYSQAFRWFREKHRLYPIIDSFVGVKGVVKFFYKLPMYDETFNTYEEAELACLDKLIEICKTK
jgi:hypothetical protein